MKSKLIALEALRWLAAALAVLFILFLLGSTPDPAIPFETVEQAAVSQFDLSDVQPGDTAMLRRLYGLSSTDYEGVLFYYPASNMGADELLVLKLADESQSAAVSEAISKRLETQRDSFDGYGAEQFALLTDHAAVEIRGVYVLFAVCENEQAVRESFLNAL